MPRRKESDSRTTSERTDDKTRKQNQRKHRVSKKWQLRKILEQVLTLLPPHNLRILVDIYVKYCDRGYSGYALGILFGFLQDV